MPQLDFDCNVREAGVTGVPVSEQIAALTRTQSEEKQSMEVEFTEDDIASYSSSILTISTMSTCMDLDAPAVPFSQDMFEPLRCLNGNAPPRRFYRTFWRSVAMRILAMACEPARNSSISRG